MRLYELTAVFLTSVVVQTCAQNTNIAPECELVPSAGLCRTGERKTFWSFSSNTSICTTLYGCYNIKDRNVFLTQTACLRACLRSELTPTMPILIPDLPGISVSRERSLPIITPEVPEVSVSQECLIIPSPGRCSVNARRTFWSFSGTSNTCVQVSGCYSINDRNLWSSRESCQQGCSTTRNDRSTNLLLPNIPPPLVTPDTANAQSTPGYRVAIECRVTPSVGVCSQNNKKTLFTYSSKAGSCVEIYGCYSVRDRNTFHTLEICKQNCLIPVTVSGQEWRRDAQCNINPSTGRCTQNQKRTLWTYSSKTSTCTQISGCYNIRDRNTFVTLEGCESKCVGPVGSKFLISETAVDTTQTRVNVPLRIATECRIVPEAGQCRDPEKRTFYSYTGKTGDCTEIYGCFGVRDRNVFLTQSECRRSCFLSDTDTSSGFMEPQCFLNPSAGRCSNAQKKTFWSYSSKTMTCTQIYGCYSVRDRNVFRSRGGCEQTCTVDASITIPTIPEGSKVSVECRISPSAGQCLDAQKRTYFTYSTKTGRCTPIYGCFSPRDRNVFLTTEGCLQNCIITETDQAPSVMAAQCYMNPSAGRCTETQKRIFWSYSSKMSSCTQIFGCYTVNDRNIFTTREGCERACAVNTNATLPDISTSSIFSECRINPAAGQCREDQKSTYYSYSLKIGACTQIYGCYSVRDRNVFLTIEECSQNCIISDTDQPTGETSPQCYVNPSPGRCAEAQKNTFWSYSSKIMTCTQIFGCYSIRDRNVFSTRAGCEKTCAVDTNMTIPTIPEGSRLSTDCRVIPAVGLCRDNQKASYFTYSPKIGTCTQIYGCYSIRDRNVFLTVEECNQNCFISDIGQPSGSRSQQCNLNPSQGRCTESQKQIYWSYSSKIMTCTQIYGCYGIRDRNVFQSRDGCESACAVDTNMTISTLPDGSHLSGECRVVPSPGRCADSQKKIYYSYSSKTGTCTDIYGCYDMRDRNVFLSRERCDLNCFISDTSTPTGEMDRQCQLNPSPGRCAESEKRRVWSYSAKTMACTELYGCYSITDRNVFQTHDRCDQTCAVNQNMTISTLPDGSHLSIECRVNPTPGSCSENQHRAYYSYSPKTGTCTMIYGCYSIRDRNVFLTSNDCSQYCFVQHTSTQPEINPRMITPSRIDQQCYLNPSPGQCTEIQMKTVWSYSSKTMTCIQLYGCYSITDRNVFQIRERCDQTCSVDIVLPTTPPPGTDIAIECRISPSAGQCPENEKRIFFSYSTKTGACTQIYGCYSIRDRNVFLADDGCVNSCFVTDTSTSSGLDRQCYLIPSPGRCIKSRKITIWTYSSKTMSCAQLHGCYSIRDRNVFQTRFGCEQTCSIDSILPTTPLPGTDVALECRISPSPGICAESQRKTFYSYSNKVGGCTQIYGCYTIQDRNVFWTSEGCNQNCFITNTSTPAGIDRQCSMNPYPGRCAESQKQIYWSYSTKASVCTQIFGCYSLRDRNVFQRQSQCERACEVDTSIVHPSSPPGTKLSIECRLNPSPGSCSEGNRNVYYTYSSKTGGCTQIFGCYGVRDRNVFITAEDCSRDCFTDGSAHTGVDRQCYITASPGRCMESQKESFYTFSSKTLSCVVIYGCYSVRDRNVFRRKADCDMMCEDNSMASFETNLTSITIESGLRIAKECHLNPSPGICIGSQMQTFWSFSTKTNTCTRITGCYDIHDRNTWLTQIGCEENCFKNDNVTITRETIPLECQMNPTPGRCLPSEKRSFWNFNNKLGRCARISGCYDLHDRNVWSSLMRCETKCSIGNIVTLPTPTEQPVAVITTELPAVHIAKECRMNPSPGRCLESQRRTFWSFSSKTGSCLQITGCYNMNDRNTWMDREACVSNCFINNTDIMPPDDTIALECKLIPSPGMCIESERKTVYVYSEKLGACVDISGCYDFHDRNVWISREACEKNCHVNSTDVLPVMSEYDVALECQMSPTPGRCKTTEHRPYYSYSSKVGGCVEIYGCYTINDRNVWFTRNGCTQGCLTAISGPDTPLVVAPGCMVTPTIKECRPNQKQVWFSYNQTTESCQMVSGCYRLGERNVFINEKKCEKNCFGTNRKPSHHGISTECRLHPAPGICREEERRTFWSYSQKISSCVRITGCYTLRDRNMWPTREVCNNRCLTDNMPRSNILPNFLAGLTPGQNRGVRRGRRGRLIARSMNQVGNTETNTNINVTTDMKQTALVKGQGLVLNSSTDAVQTAVPVARESRGSAVKVMPVSKVITNLFNN